ncbi:DUF4932 domain-containing protein [Dysgonomonas sp. Marseille-P4677]|uniref:DUF4932 domain-containing protein n=1 Tax=Dysgonomonas sp. Marseille-P4677 TaxID=2364790 RepID=UPI001912041A|nr:DUF4932 domain-containing protein [Dysgonomonas sp. Marseille-P4677]MBK5721262.1 DUF4932 domain-containing protein [Dysgonomonas sp. Marseille-P4677]
MKKICLLFVAVCSINVFAQQNPTLSEPEIDKRTELLSIVFRLAGNNEYNRKDFKLYTDRIEQYFRKYESHGLVEYTRSLVSEYSIGYNAPMSLAVHLDNNLDIRKDVTLDYIDGRWNNVDLKKYLLRLKKFSKDTKFDKFFEDNADLYVEARRQFMPIYEKIDLEWFAKFFGEGASDTFYIINGLSNGGPNYGASVLLKDGGKENYSVMGLWSVGDGGMPRFPKDSYLPIVIHEFSHAFVNHLNEKHSDILKERGEEVFSIVGESMAKQAYPSWQIMMNEALVRAAVIKYEIDHNAGQQKIDMAVDYEMSRSFLWIKELVAVLQEYDKQRDRYPTLDSYMPKIAEAYTDIAKTILEAEPKRPNVISISEFSNGDTNVSSYVKTITINFDRPLNAGNMSVDAGTKGIDGTPAIKKGYYINDNKTFVMDVELVKDKEYQIILKGRGFATPDGYRIKDYEINFKTAE